ncbi:MAG: hypothetical protein JOZ24_12030, partial [Candidatus Eremiobacteraeota bacterium]|nr:hypothetical protein [Candidatus Eremiobacteraeota bacterium]
LVLARSTRNAAAAHTAFCLCVSPPSLLAQARRLASPRFGSRLLVVLAGESQRLASEWPASFHDAVIVSPPINGTALAARARSTDAVLILADARPPILMRSAVFSATAAHGYLQQLGHRGYRIRPQGATRNDVLVLSRTTQQDRGRSSFARRFHAVAGYQPSDEAVRAYAAAEIVRSSGPTRAAVRSALRTRSFATVLGRVRFNADGYWDRVSLIASPT